MNDNLHVLLIEDNPGDARLIEEMFRDAEELSRRIDPDVADESTPAVTHETRLSDGLEYAEAHAVDIVLLDLHLPDSDGLDTLAAVVERLDAVPIVVLTGTRDQLTGVEALQRGAHEYLVKDEVTSPLLVRSIHHAIERQQQEAERARRREELESLNRLNRIGQDITRAVITTATREELEQAVCERLVEPDAYRFVWIGTVSRGSRQVTPRIAAGVEAGYLDEITITIDDSETAEGPTGTAVEEKTIQIVDDVRTDPSFEPWRDEAADRGYRSTAAVPLVHEDFMYGVLNVYAAEPHAFGQREREIFARMGAIVGHAITALERKQALVSDDALELEFQVEGVVEPLVSLSAAEDGAVQFDRLIRSDESVLLYGTVDGIPPEAIQKAVDDVDVVDDVRTLTPSDDEYEIEVVAERGMPLFEGIASHGGRVRSVRVDRGELRVIAEVPRQGNTGNVIETIESVCEGATYIAQRTVEREHDRVPGHSALETRLTAKQRDALETAFNAGYFDWPRTTTGEEVAERLGISPATFTQHLRAAEGKFFDAVLGDGSGNDEASAQ